MHFGSSTRALNYGQKALKMTIGTWLRLPIPSHFLLCEKEVDHEQPYKGATSRQSNSINYRQASVLVKALHESGELG